MSTGSGLSCGWTPISEGLFSRSWLILRMASCGWTPISEGLFFEFTAEEVLVGCGWTPISEGLFSRRSFTPT